MIYEKFYAFFSLVIIVYPQSMVNALAIKRVTVVGGGAAGLIAADNLLRKGFEVVILEKSSDIGGIWRYSPEGSSAMYDSLRTNLPTELMSIHPLKPFDIRSKTSYATHSDVFHYLKAFTIDQKLLSSIYFNCDVSNVEKIGSEWYATYSSPTGDNQVISDAILICNGHFSKEYIPHNPKVSFDSFPGEIIHSMKYDKLKRNNHFRHKRILVIGSRSSGTDIARELLSSDAAAVHISMRSIQVSVIDSLPPRHPSIIGVTTDGRLIMSDGIILDIDIILLCTGYEYSFPFLSNSIIDIENGKRVKPLYLQLFPLNDLSIRDVVRKAGGRSRRDPRTLRSSRDS